jgi:hypothetical protein
LFRGGPGFPRSSEKPGPGRSPTMSRR